jgi:hypothetical protein
MWPLNRDVTILSSRDEFGDDGHPITSENARYRKQPKVSQKNKKGANKRPPT